MPEKPRFLTRTLARAGSPAMLTCLAPAHDVRLLLSLSATTSLPGIACFNNAGFTLPLHLHHSDIFASCLWIDVPAGRILRAAFAFGTLHVHEVVSVIRLGVSCPLAPKSFDGNQEKIGGKLGEFGNSLNEVVRTV